MAGAEKKTVYCDTNVVLDWIGRNDARPESTAAAGLLREILDKKLTCVISSITRLEVLECKNSSDAWRVWNNLQSLRNVHIQSLTNRVLDISYEMRNFYQSLRDSDPSLKKPPLIPDAIHIATAIYCEVNEMFSFDSGKMDKGPRSDRHLSPLELSGRIANKWTLDIKKPTDFDPSMVL